MVARYFLEFQPGHLIRKYWIGGKDMDLERMKQKLAEMRAGIGEYEVQTEKTEQVHDGLEELWESRNLPDQEKQDNQQVQEKITVAIVDQGGPQEECIPGEPNEEILFENKDIVLRESILPGKIEELRDFILLSSEKLNAYRARLRAADKLNIAKELRDKAVEEGQILAEEVFKAEAKLGELLLGLRIRGGDRKSESFKNQTSPVISLNSMGITEKQSYEAQKIAFHPKIVEQVLKEAKWKNEIPYKTEIMRKINRPELKSQREDKEMRKRYEILTDGKLNLKDIGIFPGQGACLYHVERICLVLLPRLYKYELLMEELWDRIKFVKEKGERHFKIATNQKPIMEFLGCGFTQDFIAILQAFGFKVEWPEGVTLSPRTNKYQRVKARRKRMAYYRRKGKLWT
jgi:hypothetical protein